MQTWKVTVAAAALAAIGSTGAMAQTANENTLTPSTKAQPAPAVPASEGASSGESGVTSPAGIAADPTTNENQQPGMSPQNPSDPATGNNPEARVPSSPAGTGTSAP